MKFLKKHPLFTGLLAVAITPIILVAADNIKKPTMVIDVGQEGYFIGVTPEYRYAVIAAILPYFSDAAKKLDLPIKLPITTSDLIPGGGGIYPFRKTVGGAVTLKSGWVFSFRDGYVDTIEDEHSYAADKNPYKTDRFFGTVNMTTNEAIAFARETIRKLGIPLESVFAEQEPIVEGPINDDNKIVPHYDVKWIDPRNSRGQSCSARVEINGEKKKVERIDFSNSNLIKPPPKIDVAPLPGDNWPAANMEYAIKLLPYVMKAIDDYGKRMSLPIPYPLTTNHIKLFKFQDNGGKPYVDVTLTNGWEFNYVASGVSGYSAPDRFLYNSTPMLIKDVAGKWNMTEEEAINLARKAIKKIDCDPSLYKFIDDKPSSILKPFTTGKTIIPRYFFSWEYAVKLPPPTDGGSRSSDEEHVASAYAEVDAGTKTVKSVSFWHRSLPNKAPKIDLPLTLPQDKKNFDPSQMMKNLVPQQ